MRTKSPNFWWIISIMCAVIISLVSFIISERTCDAGEIMEFISYSSTLLSITLSIFAIQYTYTSNVQIQQQFEKINAAAEDIRNTAKNLNLTSCKLDDNLGSIFERLENIDQSQKEMSYQLNNMNTTVNEASTNNYQYK